MIFAGTGGISKTVCNSALLMLMAVACLMQPGYAETAAPRSSRFDIDAPTLSPALIQFSRQSGLAIVFSDQLTQSYQILPIIGTLNPADAMNRLLAGTGLTWELIDDRIVAVYASDCAKDACASMSETLDNFPVHVPGIEETFVYGSLTTGSRIRRSGGFRSAPVEIVTAPEIELSGVQTLGELLRFTPAVAGNSASTAISNGGDGTASVTLRGLPASNTLILINGRRVANDGLAGESVDLNSIPPAAVARVEILKDGASAIYGSDAIAGVINVIMKQDFRGFLAEAFYGAAEAGDLNTRTTTFQYGTETGNGSLFVTGSQYQQDPIFSRDRKVSRSADTRAQGGVDLRSSATPDARLLLPDGTALIAEGTGYRPVTDDDLYNYQSVTTAVVPLKRNSIYGSVNYDFNEQITATVELSYLESEASASLAPTPIFSAFEQVPLTVAADNIYNPFGVAITDARRRLVEFPERQQRNTAEVKRVSAVLEGLHANWNWDLGYTWSRSDASEVTTNLVNARHLQRGVGPAGLCQGIEIDGCVAVDLLGPAGSISPQQVEYLTATGAVNGFSELSSFSVNIVNPLLSLRHGRGDVALGAEYREESTRKQPDALLATAGTIGGTNFERTAGKRRIAEVYLETALPVWRHPRGVASVHLDAALRYSSYSDFGNSTNPKLGVRVQVGPSLLLRASYALGFRAPSLNELHEGRSEEQAFLDDPCSRPSNVATLQGCQQLADVSRNQFLVVRGGNAMLKPETSENFTLGMVANPDWLPGLHLSLDWFQIMQQDVVSSSAQFIVRENARFGAFAGSVQRDTQGNLALVTANNINIGSRRISGADIGFSYQFPASRWGLLRATGSGSYLHDYLAQADVTAPRFNFAGTFRDEASEGLGGIPAWKWQFGLRWNRAGWNAGSDIHFVGSMKELIPTTSRERDIKAWAILDAQIGYTFKVFKGLRWSFGVDNALATPAPLAVSAFNDNIDGRSHDLKGRFWYTRLSQRF